LLQDEEEQKQQRENIDEMQKNAKDKVMIENSADELFDSLERQKGESPKDYRERVSRSLVKAFVEDEHDKMVREYEENLFRKRLRIKKENARRSKLLREKRKANTVVIDVPKRKTNVPVAFEIVSTLGTDEELSDALRHEEKTNPNFINGVDYSEIVSITAFSMLKNKDKILDEIINETDEETEKWVKQYIEEDKERSDIFKQLAAINEAAISGKKSSVETMLDRREGVLTAGNNRFEAQQEEMKSQIQDEQSDEIGFR